MGLLEINEEIKGYLCFVFRVVVGWMFFEHGAQKLFGWFGGKAVDSLASMFGVAGVVEVVVGLAVVLGVFVKLAALFGGVQMLVAYFIVHIPNAWDPLANKGELALLYFAAFLVLLAYGTGKWSLERALREEETF